MKRVVFLALLTSLLGGCLTNPNQPPTLLRGDALEFPAQAREQGISGSVTVRYDVAADGRVRNAVVIDSSPAGVFDEAALRAVRGWRFRPGRRDGVESLFEDLTSTVDFQFGETDAYPSR